MKVTYPLARVADAMLLMERSGDGRLWGYALSKTSGVRSGVLHPQLDRMLSEGWLEDSWEERTETNGKRPPRRYYRLTQHGRAELGAVLQSAQSRQQFQNREDGPTIQDPAKSELRPSLA